MRKSNDSTNTKETLTFEEVKGKENIFKAKVFRGGQAYEVSVYAMPEEEFERENQHYMEQVDEFSECAQ